MQRELLVVDDVPDEAVRLFLAEEPVTVLLTGGATARAFYEGLTRIEFDWNEIEFFLTDERCVPFEDERCNARMAQEALVSKVGGQAYWMDGGNCDAGGYEELLRQRFKEFPRFDLAVYGLGPDGHVASLFPGRPEVEEGERWAISVPEAGWEPFVPRVSLTTPVLSGAATGMFLVTGESKREALRRLMGDEDIPAARVAPSRCVVVADREAAG